MVLELKTGFGANDPEIMWDWFEVGDRHYFWRATKFVAIDHTVVCIHV